MTLAFVIPAKNEEATVYAVASAARRVADEVGGTVLVVADNCTDNTAVEADRAGVRVLERTGGSSSKSKAVAYGIRRVDCDFVCLLDADCVGLDPTAVVRLVDPVLGGGALMSVATFDYGPWSRIVESVPWSTGQRVFPVELFPMDDPRLRDYGLELLLNEAVGRGDGVTVSQTLSGLHHRSKMAKRGVVLGVRDNVRMWASLAHAADGLDMAAYRRYARRLVVVHEGEWRRPPTALTSAGLHGLSAASRALRSVSKAA